MGLRVRVNSWFGKWRAKRRLQKQLKSGFRAETKRIAGKAGVVENPLAKQMIQAEVEQRKKIAKGETDGTTTKMQG